MRFYRVQVSNIRGQEMGVPAYYQSRSCCVFIADTSANCLSLGVLMKNTYNVASTVTKYLNQNKVTRWGEMIVKEVNIHSFVEMLVGASQSGFIDVAAGSIIGGFGLAKLVTGFYKEYDIIDGGSVVNRSECDRKEVISDRQHYVVVTPKYPRHSKTVNELLADLKDTGVIESNCYGYINLKKTAQYFNNHFESVLDCCIGKTLVVRLDADYEGAKEERMDLSILVGFLGSFRAYKNDICLIILESTDMDILKSGFDLLLPGVSFKTITENQSSISEDDTQRFIDSMMASKDFQQRLDEILGSCLSEQRAKEEEQRTLPTEEKEDPYQSLISIIGLKEVKHVIDLIINYDLACREFSDKGFDKGTISKHMAFLGSPGTAKTTVARLLAAIFKEKGILKTGAFVEVGRGEMVGKYVGHTARIVKDKFIAAQGGVLFIDEAYSLCLDSDSFGGEAINTIVQEMENHRDDVLVIFAGYPDLMEDLIDSNPGLRSRVQFKIPFPDYSVEELMQIADYEAKKLGVVLAPKTKSKLRKIFGRAKESKDFGNGRFVRNILEQAKLEQATRLINAARNNQELTEDDVKLILPPDIVFEGALVDKYKIGFTV